MTEPKKRRGLSTYAGPCGSKAQWKDEEYKDIKDSVRIGAKVQLGLEKHRIINADSDL